MDKVLKRMYNNDDIQNMIEAVESNPEPFFNAMNSKVVNNTLSFRDAEAMRHVVKEGWYEVFERYDSDVCERFIRIFESVAESYGYSKITIE